MSTANTTAQQTTTSGVPTNAHNVNDGSQGARAAEGLGEKVKGGLGVVHGAGEGIRGNVNSFLDNVGEQIAGRGQGDVKPATRTEQERPAQVAARGADEFQAGMDRLRK
ncbi:hypothetical protein DB88DRAFT_507864 [Papiliotrema laurentii]|uniref:Uncharacterized protein n=1 Tax=Papiliotrema laurentii TaxID=5418 RepID=A0AAD9FX49_PAPLA|nr:hypothetical protein DB88DRAFT_507864 [Papiliotrema laurentii]